MNIIIKLIDNWKHYRIYLITVEPIDYVIHHIMYLIYIVIIYYNII